MDKTQLEINFTKRFKKARKKLMFSGRFDNALLNEVIYKLACKERLPQKANDHSLKANWEGYRECHIESDLLLIYRIDEHTITLVNLGTHSELFGK